MKMNPRTLKDETESLKLMYKYTYSHGKMIIYSNF